MMYEALLVVDMQNALICDNPYNKEVIIQNIRQLLEACRNKQIPVIYVRHEDNDTLQRGSDGWRICPEIEPLEGEQTIEKRYNSAFRNTELHSYLQSIHAKKLIICGMQTEYCVDTTCKVAFEMGYEITIPTDTTTTFDNGSFSGKELCRFYEENIWDQRFAKVVSVEEIVGNI